MTPEQLRASILQYAMEGKLVKQDPNDEPASELVKKIENKKAELIKEGKIKKSKKLPTITDDEKPFDIPDSWEWVRLGNIFDITSSKRVMKKEWRDSGIPFYRAREIVSINKNRPLKDPIFIDEDTYLKKIKISGKPNEGDILLTGVGTLGIPYIVPKDKKFYFKDGNIIWLKNFGNLNSEYLSWYVQCPYMLKIINDNRGTTVGTLTIVRSKNLVIPIPPLEEQKRIVAKIEKLMPLVDEYAESYNRLQKIDNEFEDKLKQSVLQYAMEGKLVKQNPSDEPASELIKKIENEKAELIKEGKIKKSKKLPSINDDEKPFDIPDSWEWVRLGNVANVVMGQAPKSAYVNINGKGIEFHQGKSYFTENIIGRSEKYAAMSNKIIDSKYIVMAVRAPVGDVNLLNREISIGRGLAGIRPYISDKDYIFYYLRLIKKYFEKNSTGSTFKAINGNIIKNTPIPLPALEEQRRIVIKIKELMDAIN